MLVKDCMTRHPIMLPATSTVVSAQQIMAENDIRHIPIVGDGKRLEGLITRQRLNIKPETLGSLAIWEISQYIANLTVGKVMLKTKELLTITEDKTVERAANIMMKHHIGCLPVVEDDTIVIGIITETDLLKSYQEMLGLPASGIRVTVRMPNRAGEFAKLMTTLAENHWGVMGIGTFPSPRRPGFYDAVLKLPNVTQEAAEEIINNIPDQQVIDVRDTA